MIKFIKYITILLVTFLLCLLACSPSQPADDLSMAEVALEHHNYGVALDICQQITNGDTDNLKVSDMCRLSILLMKLSDLKDLEDNAVAATDFYRKAFATNEDSARYFYDNIPIDDARYVELMAQLQRILDHPRQVADSIFIPAYE